ncbi:NAD(P)-dependent alcohol dehydrogenase [Halocatena marina]|uniref:NAD(P)-dependent alcohol dehydrogenase n=1 Tax=Halocatena marina TaxID=2934937 RepID=UPI00200D6188|nr:NAD(P)-dependent alcohol dehydrogenase [Halocatena marina]
MDIEAAVVAKASGDFHIEELTLDEPRADEVLVRIVATGVCPADTAARDQHFPIPLPAVLGHEGAGVVEAVGDTVTNVEPGDHVVLSFDHDQTCRNCREGNAAYCSNIGAYNFSGVRGTDMSSPLHRDGEQVSLFFGQSSFATHSIASERQVIPVPADVPLEILGPLGCSIQTGSGTVINTFDANAGSSIAVFGVGAVGLSAVLGAVIAGCTTIIAVDLLEDRLDVAADFGATHALDSREEDDITETIRDITNGGVDYSVETTAVPRVARQAVASTRIPGICGLLGGASSEPDPTLDMNDILNGRIVRGVSQGDSVPEIFIPQLIDLYRQDRFPFDELITFYELDEINQAFADSENGRAIKPVLCVDEV